MQLGLIHIFNVCETSFPETFVNICVVCLIFKPSVPRGKYVGVEQIDFCLGAMACHVRRELMASGCTELICD